MNILVIIGCLIAGATVGVLLMACFAAAGRSDDWAEQFHAQLNREEVERRTLYHEARRRAAQ